MSRATKVRAVVALLVTLAGGCTAENELYGVMRASDDADVASPTDDGGGDLTIDRTALIDLAPHYNTIGIYSEGSSFPKASGINGFASACSAQLLAAAPTWRATPITGAPNVNNTVQCAGQRVALPPGAFAKLRVIATATFGPRVADFVVEYADGSSTRARVSVSDWLNRPKAPAAAEEIAALLPFYIYYTGDVDPRTNYLYGYTIDLDPARTVAYLWLPPDVNVAVFAVSLATR